MNQNAPQHHPLTGIVFISILAVIALAGIITGAVLAANDYSSAGAFAISSACVGVLGTLAVQYVGGPHPPIIPPPAPPTPSETRRPIKDNPQA